ncbi:MAG TPA: hypothetical protein VIR57_06625 [Chloroflexota bacterium]
MKPRLQLPAKRVWRCELRYQGLVVVAPGDTVQPDSVVAEGQTLPPPIVVELGPAQALVAAGQEVQAGDVVGRRKKLLGSGEEVRAPVAGKVLLVTESELLLEPPPLAIALEAQLPGVVAAVRTGWGVDVEGCFGLLRGWASSGASCHGLLGESIAVVPEPLTTGRLQALASQGVRAVLGSSWAEDESPSSDVVPDGPATFLTEPLPGRPMAAPIAETLHRHLGQPVALSLGPQPLLGFASNSADESQCFGPGAWVRTADGRTGRLVSTGQSPRFFASGLRGVPADVDLGDRTETLPLDSLDWIA